MTARSSQRRNLHEFVAISLVALSLIAAIYWPLRHAGFVWVDKICFHDEAWLRVGDAWKHLIFTGFYEWVNYFRPLVVALFVFEVRFLDASPGAMHLVSLGMHLLNTLWVGLLALRLCGGTAPTTADRLRAGAAMLVFGLHPAMVEPVSWISCQFEIVVTFFILLGLWLHAAPNGSLTRSAAVATCFFLAACAKESAAVFPLLLLLQDWMAKENSPPRAPISSLLLLIWKRQRTTYVLVLLAGIAYLALRARSLGFLVAPVGHEPLAPFARLQTICYTYLAYWRILVWPMADLGPLHEVGAARFTTMGGVSLGFDIAAATIFAAGVWLTARRNPAGALILAVSAALLPVLHIVPVRFDDSLYHERYAMTALAVACVWLAVVLGQFEGADAWRKGRLAGLAMAAAALWLGLAVINIRVTLPLWSDEVLLWQWVLREHPDSITARQHLLSSYKYVGDYRHARILADQMVADDTHCANCLANAAYLYLAVGDAARAALALEKLGRLSELRDDPDMLESYILAMGQLRQLRGDFTGAEDAYRDAINLHPFDPGPASQLSLLFAQTGRIAEARVEFAKSLELSSPDERAGRIRNFEAVLARSARATPAPQ